MINFLTFSFHFSLLKAVKERLYFFFFTHKQGNMQEDIRGVVTGCQHREQARSVLSFDLSRGNLASNSPGLSGATS